MRARYSIHLADYCAKTAIEANTVSEMILRHILPGVKEYENMLSELILNKKDIGINVDVDKDILSRIGLLVKKVYKVNGDMLSKLAEAPGIMEGIEAAVYYRENILRSVEELGALLSNLEALVGAEYWPYPTYEDILF